MISSIKGMKDILPDETYKWQFIENTIHKISQIFNYKEIRTPLLEQTNLFKRSIGEETDIVSKEMYTFFDRSNESLTLKPEGTASVVRSFIQNHFSEEQPISKLYYISPMFRQERPQAGRLRQFHQYGAEIFGTENATADAEIILLNTEILKKVGIKNFNINLNSVGCQICRPKYKQVLISELNLIKSKLSEQSQARLENNPLRVLDSKEKQDQEAIKNIPTILDFLCNSCKTHFEDLQTQLKSIKLDFKINNKLVRGLDYYTKTAFEISSESLGSQDALAGGGRYDLLTEQLGGKKTAAVGFAGGIERLLISLEKENVNFAESSPLQIYLAAADDEGRKFVFRLAQELRSSEISVDFDLLNRSVKSQLREADKKKAKYLILVGENELKQNSISLKNMQDGTSNTFNIPVKIKELASHLK